MCKKCQIDHNSDRHILNRRSFKGSNNPMFGKQHSDETKIKIGIKSIGRKSFLGRKHSEETKSRLSQYDHSGHGVHFRSKVKTFKGSNNPMFGKEQSDLCKQVNSQIRKGKKLSLIHRQKLLGHKNLNPNGWGKGGYREDLNHFVRSTWEANICRIFRYLGIIYEYEPTNKRICFDNCSYLPDFYLPQLDLYVEVKGSRFGNRDKKLELLYKQDPHFPIKIIDGEVYNKLKREYFAKILKWEK